MKLFIHIFCLLCLSYKNFGQVLTIAHRGASDFAPENTIAAFDSAITFQVDFIETDLQITSDEELVIMHDKSINRTCEISDEIIKKYGNKKILVSQLNKTEFKTLKIKNSTDSPPTLEEAIRFIDGRTNLLLEIKSSGRQEIVENKLLKLIEKYNASSWITIIHSFDKKTLKRIQFKNKNLQLHKLIVFKFPLCSFNFSGKIDFDNFANWQGVNPHYRFCSKRLIKKLHKLNKKVFVWTVNDKKWAKKLIERGVDGIITNNPRMIKEIIEKK